MCGVPYGEIDVDRLLNSLIARRPIPSAARRVVGVLREGALGARVAAVREVPDVPQRVLAPRGAQRDGDVQAPRGRARCAPASLERRDARRLHRRRAAARARRARADRRCSPRCASGGSTSACFECPAAELPPRRGEWIADDRALDRRGRGPARARARARAGRAAARLSRRRRRCSASTSPCCAATASVRRLTADGLGGRDQPAEAVRGAVPVSARWLRVFAAGRCRIARGHRALARCRAEVRDRLERDRCSA